MPSLPLSTVAKRLSGKFSSAWEIHEKAIELKRQGKDVILLSVGDPNFRTPDPIIDNAISHMCVGRTHYSPALGEINFRRAVSDLETRTSPHPCSPDEVAILPGGTSAIYVVMSCLLNAGDGIIIIDPMYIGYSSIMKALNVRVVTVQTRCEDNFEPNISAICAAVTNKTKVIFINTPNNPTGTLIPKQKLNQLARYCYDMGIWLVCDEMYSMFTFEKPHISIRAGADKLDNIVMIDGLSKSHAMSGWRMAWVVAPTSLIKHIGNFSDMAFFCSPQFIQDAAAFALSNDEYYVKKMCNEYKERRNFVCQQLDAIPSVNYHMPSAGMFVMIDISSINPDDSAFAADLLNEQLLSVIPGSEFGQSTEGYIRFSLTQPIDILRQGCERLQIYAQNSYKKNT